MMIRSGLTFFVCLLFVIGINQRMQGAELKDFQTNMDNVKKSIKNTENIKKNKLDAVNRKLEKAEGKEITKLYVKKVTAIGEICDEYAKAEKFLDNAISDMQDADSWLQGEGVEGGLRQSMSEQIKGSLEAMTSNVEMMDEISGSISDIPDVKGLEHIKASKEMLKMVIKEMKERYSRSGELLKERLGHHPDKPNNPEVIEGMKASLEYYKILVALNKAVYTAEFYKCDSTGKLMLEVAQLEELEKQAFNGMDVDEYLKDIIELPGSTMHEQDLWEQDLQNIFDNFRKGRKTLKEGVVKRIEDFRKAPQPGKVTHEYFCDENPNHRYYRDDLNADANYKERWYWQEGDLRGERHYLPFDYKAGTGKYIECKDGKWYSFAPIHNGERVQIFFDGEEEN
jgi:hypothetical protein